MNWFAFQHQTWKSTVDSIFRFNLFFFVFFLFHFDGKIPKQRFDPISIASLVQISELNKVSWIIITRSDFSFVFFSYFNKDRIQFSVSILHFFLRRFRFFSLLFLFFFCLVFFFAFLNGGSTPFSSRLRAPLSPLFARFFFLTAISLSLSLSHSLSLFLS